MYSTDSLMYSTISREVKKYLWIPYMYVSISRACVAVGNIVNKLAKHERQLIGWRYTKQSSTDLVTPSDSIQLFVGPLPWIPTTTTTITTSTCVTRIERLVYCTKFSLSWYAGDHVRVSQCRIYKRTRTYRAIIPPLCSHHSILQLSLLLMLRMTARVVNLGE